MKTLLNWVGNPCIHMIVFGLIVSGLATSRGSEKEVQWLVVSPPICRKCRQSHVELQDCRKPIATVVRAVASK